MDRTVRDLRGASLILKAPPTDLAYAVPATSTRRTRVERLCVDARRAVRLLDGDGATPAAPTAACSTGTKIATLKSTSSTGFTYDGATSSATPGARQERRPDLQPRRHAARGKTASSTLQASAARRSAGTLPITDDDLDADVQRGRRAAQPERRASPSVGPADGHVRQRRRRLARHARDRRHAADPRGDHDGRRHDHRRRSARPTRSRRTSNAADAAAAHDESGAALITALLCTMVMLALGLALLAIVDTQASESTAERTRDRGFNLSESVLNSEAFVLGRNWPDARPSPATPPAARRRRLRRHRSARPPRRRRRGRSACGPTSTPATPTRPTPARPGRSTSATTTTAPTVWNDTLLDQQGLGRQRQRQASGSARSRRSAARPARSSASSRSREPPRSNPKYGLVAGNVAEDLGPTTVGAHATRARAACSPTACSTPTRPSPPTRRYPVARLRRHRPALRRCSTNVAQVKTCVTGAIGALSAVPAVNTLVTSGTLRAVPDDDSTSADDDRPAAHAGRSTRRLHRDGAGARRRPPAGADCGDHRAGVDADRSCSSRRSAPATSTATSTSATSKTTRRS